MAEEVVLMKGNDAIAHHPSIGSAGNPCRTKAMGKNRHGGRSSRK